MIRITTKYLLALPVFCLSYIFSSAQQHTIESESLPDVSDKLIKNEIASFAKKGSILNIKDSSLKAPLTEIPVRKCSDKEIALWWNTFFGSVSTFIHLYFKTESSIKQLDSIFLVTHSHFRVNIPADAYAGIFTTVSCDFDAEKKGKFYSDHYKAFYSKDKKRLYIYMMGETDFNRYEVTWVIINNKYTARVLDKIE